jgi:hypothetical protein
MHPLCLSNGRHAKANSFSIAFIDRLPSPALLTAVRCDVRACLVALRIVSRTEGRGLTLKGIYWGGLRGTVSLADDGWGELARPTEGAVKRQGRSQDYSTLVAIPKRSV